MAVCTYYNFTTYIDSASDLQTKITRIDQIIDALETQAITSASESELSDYMFDDGQSIIRATYRSPENIAQAIDAFEKIKQRYIGRLTGRTHILKDKGSTSRYPLY